MTKHPTIVGKIVVNAVIIYDIIQPMKQRGFLVIQVVIAVIVTLLITSLGYLILKRTDNTKQNNFTLRFDTLQGGEFDIQYPSQYSASQDYFTKAVTFKLSNCNQNCDTLIIAEPLKESTISGERVKIGDYEFNKSIQDDTLVLYPKSIDRLGLISVRSTKVDSQSSIDFVQIINSLKFVKEVKIPLEAQNNPKSSIASILSPTIKPYQSPKFYKLITPTTPPLWFEKYHDTLTGPNHWAGFPNLLRNWENIPENQLVGLKCYWSDSLPNDQKSVDLINKLKESLTIKYFCQTEQNQSLVSGTHTSKSSAVLVDQNNNLTAIVEWEIPQKDDIICLFPIALRVQNSLLLSEQTTYFGCSPRGFGSVDIIYKINFNRKTVQRLNWK